MKIIPIHNTPKIQHWIKGLQEQNATAQKEYYNFTSPKMLSVCRTYIQDLQFAEDCMIKGFVKVFQNCNQYKNQGSFEGWVRRIMINECLTFLRLNKKLNALDENTIEEQMTDEPEFEFEAQSLLDQLPEGYRVVFNLYVLEEMSHQEIASLLKISESTSKSQLFKAKKKLRMLIQNPQSVQQ